MALDQLTLNLDVVLGKCRLPLGRVLRMGRGAIVPLDCGLDDLVEIRANGLPVATGRVHVKGDAIAIEIVELTAKPAMTRALGATIGGLPKPSSDTSGALAA